jgi:hypothetical protein
MRSGHTLPFLEPQGLKRIGLKSVQDKCSNLTKGISFQQGQNRSSIQLNNNSFAILFIIFHQFGMLIREMGVGCPASFPKSLPDLCI